MKRRIVLYGAKHSGKTTLAQRLLTDQYSDTYVPTTGIDYIDGAQIWDASGNPKYQSITNSYIPGNRNFCIIFDPSNFEGSIERCNYYLEQIKTKCRQDDVQIQFIVSKCDLDDDINAIEYDTTDADGNTTKLTGRAAITAQLQQIITQFNQDYKQEKGKTEDDPNPIFSNIIFCSAKDPTKGTAFNQIFANFPGEEESESSKENGKHGKPGDDYAPTVKPTPNPNAPWSTKKFYGWGKSLLSVALLLTVGFILTSVFQDGLSADTLSGMNLGFFIGIAIFSCIAASMFAKALGSHIAGNPGKNSSQQSHPIQLAIKAIVVVALISVLGALASTDLVIPVISPVLQATMDAFSQFNFSTGLQATLPGALVPTLAILFLAAASYFIIDTVCRIYNSRNHTANAPPSTPNSGLTWLFHWKPNGTGNDDDNDDVTANLLKDEKQSNIWREMPSTKKNSEADDAEPDVAVISTHEETVVAPPPTQ